MPRSTISRLPPLNALRAFVVAAKHLSFSRAAEELSVTPAAVSQQVRQLEDHLGCALFRRTSRQLLLTDEGQACLPGLAEGFEHLIEALAALDAVGEGGVLTVSVAPSFAAKWLLPRVDAFAIAHPEIDLRISAAMHLVDFETDDVDCAIRYGQGAYPGLVVEHFLSESVLPVASPSLVDSARIKNSADLARVTLLHDDGPDRDASCPDWAMWLKAAGVAADASRGPRFDQSSLVLEAAAMGRGVALAKQRLAETDLLSGRLVQLFDLRQPVSFAYYFVCPTRKRALGRVQAFHAWLLNQVAADSGALDYTI